MHGITFLQTRLMQQGSIPTLSALLPLPSAMRNSPGTSGDTERVRRENRMVARQEGVRRLDPRKNHTVEQNQQAIRGKDRASPYGRMFAGHFCSP